MQRLGSTATFYTTVLGIALLAGIGPALFNFVIDPYDRDRVVDLGIEKAPLSEKAHYPLWKMFHYEPQKTGVVILGDSRARALRDKLWHELGQTNAYNFAYGAATVPEIYDTFAHVKDNPNLKALVIGVSLRSFNEGHRGNMNRVPEAIELTNNPLEYYTSWFVTKIGWRHLKARYPKTFERMSELQPQLITAAAASYDTGRSMPLSELLSPEACIGCNLPEATETPLPIRYRTGRLISREYGRWDHIWPPIAIDRELPTKFERQVRKNGRSDWKGFKFSEALWAQIAEIANWCDQNNIKLIFVIPPTISDMQARTMEFGHGHLNHQFRLRLATLAPVVDFDFDNDVTRDFTKFSDAYHFKSKQAREIVGELTQFITPNPLVIQKARKKRGDFICPVEAQDEGKTFSDGITRMTEGKACRIWISEES